MRAGRKSEPQKARGAVVGIGTAVTVTMTMVMVLTSVVLNGGIGEGTGEKLAGIIPIFAVFCGAEIGKITGRRRDWVLPAVVSGAYFGILVIYAMLSPVGFRNIIPCLVSVCIGFLFSCALCFCNKGRSGKRKKGIW